MKTQWLNRSRRSWNRHRRSSRCRRRPWSGASWRRRRPERRRGRCPPRDHSCRRTRRCAGCCSGRRPSRGSDVAAAGRPATGPPARLAPAAASSMRASAFLACGGFATFRFRFTERKRIASAKRERERENGSLWLLLVRVSRFWGIAGYARTSVGGIGDTWTVEIVLDSKAVCPHVRHQVRQLDVLNNNYPFIYPKVSDQDGSRNFNWISHTF